MWRRLVWRLCFVLSSTLWGVGWTLASLPGPDPGNLPQGVPPEVPLESLLATRWSVDEGLPSTALNNVLQTRDGYLWIASFDGLIRFDGLVFDVFDKNNLSQFTRSPETFQFSGTGFHELAEDPEGNLWIGCQGGGVLRYADGHFESLAGEALARATVRTILPLGGGHAWVGVSDQGAWELRDGRWSRLEHPVLDGVTVRDLAVAPDDGLWLATEGNGLARWHNGSVDTFTEAEGLVSDALTSLHVDALGTVWVGTLEGLNVLRNGVVETLPEFRGVEILRLTEDARGNLWIASEQGLYRWRADGGFEYRQRFENESLRGVTGTIVDRDNNLWVTSTNVGLLRFKQRQFHNYTVDDGLSAERIDSLWVDGGGVLVSSDTGRLHRIEDGEVTDLTLDTLPETRVRDIYRDPGETLWISTYLGLVEVQGTFQQFWTTANGLPTNQVRLVLRDSQDNLWIGTRNAGLVRMRHTAPGQGVVLETFDNGRGLLSNFVFALLEHPDGRLFVGTRGGLNVLTPRTGADGQTTYGIVTHGKAEGFPGTIAFNLDLDAVGDLWLSTNSGLSRFRQGIFQTLTVAQGLDADTIFDTAEDLLGNLWLSSNFGMMRVPKQQVIDVFEGRLRQAEARLFDDRDGMVSRQSSAATDFHMDLEGRLWIPTIRGVSVIDPLELKRNPVPPSVQIPSILADDRRLVPQEPMVLAPGTRRLSIRFAALSLGAPLRVDVRYRLHGFDPDWVRAGKERQVSYTNLPPGHYRFEVKAANLDGVWTEESVGLDITLEPFIHQRWSMRLLALGVLALLGMELFRWRLGAFRTRNDQLQQIVTEQRLTAQALRESEQRFRVLFAEASDAILILDDGRIVDCNARAMRLFGYSRGQLLEMDVSQLDFAEGEGGLAHVVTEALEATVGLAWSLQARLQKKNGVAFDAEVTLSMVRLQGRPVVQAILRDISERLRAIAEREHLIRQLASRSEEMQRFTYAVSHDLKSPLFTIQGFLAHLERDVAAGHEERIRKDLERIRTATGQMNQLLEDLLELSRVGELRSEPAVIPFGELAHAAIELASGRVEERRVEVEICPDLPAVEVDRTRLLQVLQNLVDNAIKFMGDQSEPKLEIGCRRDAHDTVFYVRDNGSGIAPENLDKVFGVFERLGRKEEGTGIGLAVVQRIVESHGGRIWVESEGLGKGSTFCFTLG